MVNDVANEMVQQERSNNKCYASAFRYIIIIIIITSIVLILFGYSFLSFYFNSHSHCKEEKLHRIQVL